MDLVSSLHREGSRGGVNFSWADVTTSQHRDHYLGHSLMAPVGRWQKGKDLNWYAKVNDENDMGGATAEEKRAWERKEEIKKIKEAEEDALAKALGLPVVSRNIGEATGANGISIGEIKRVIKETEEGDDGIGEVGRGQGFKDYVGKIEATLGTSGPADKLWSGEMAGNTDRAETRISRNRKGQDAKRDGRDRSRSPEKRHHRRRSRSREEYRERRTHRRRSRSREEYRERRIHRRRSRSREEYRVRRTYRRRSRSSEEYSQRRTSDAMRERRSRSPERK